MENHHHHQWMLWNVLFDRVPWCCQSFHFIICFFPFPEKISIHLAMNSSLVWKFKCRKFSQLKNLFTPLFIDVIKHTHTFTNNNWNCSHMYMMMMVEWSSASCKITPNGFFLFLILFQIRRCVVLCLCLLIHLFQTILILLLILLTKKSQHNAYIHTHTHIISIPKKANEWK
mgnify:FL=1